MSDPHFKNFQICYHYPYMDLQNRYYSSVLHFCIFWGEAHALHFLRILNFFFLKIVLRSETHASSLSNKLDILNLFVWEKNKCLAFLENFEFFLMLMLVWNIICLEDMSLKWLMCDCKKWYWRWYYAGQGPFRINIWSFLMLWRNMDGFLHAMKNMCF